MAARQRDVKIRILSEYYDEGSKAAERAMRRNAQLQMAAQQEDIARELAKTKAIERANARQRAAMATTGKAVLGVSALIAVGLGLSAKAAIDWESAWTGVTKTVDGSAEEMAVLEQQLRGLARTLPVTHEEIAGVAEVAGQLGVKRQDVASFTKTMIDMGQTTNLSSEDAATGMAKLLNITGETNAMAGRLGSTIVDLGNNSATTEADILDMDLRIAAAGRTVGMTTAQTLGLSAALSSVGLESEAGGSAISRVMLQIDSDVAKGSSRLTDYARVAGVSSADFARTWREDAGKALTMFIQGLGDLQAQGADTTTILDEMGFSNLRVSDAIRRASLAGDLLGDSMDRANKAWEENIALTQEAEKRYETAESKIAIARNQLNDTAIDIGGLVAPAVAAAADEISALAAGFQALSPEQQKWVVSLAGLAAGIGGLVGTAAVVVPKMVELKNTLDGLSGGASVLGKALGGVGSLLTGPWGLAIAGAITIGALWLRNQGEIRQRVDALRQSLDSQTGAWTENTRTAMYNSLQESGVVAAAKKRGIDLSDLLTASIDHNSDSYRRIAAAAQDAQDQYFAAAQSQDTAKESVYDLADANKDLQWILDQLGISQGELATAQSEYNDRVAAGVAPNEAAATAAGGLTDELSAQDQAAQKATDALDELARSMDDLNAPAKNAQQAELDWRNQLDEATAALETNGATLDLNTKAGRDNRQQLLDLADAGAKRAEGVLKETESVDAYRASLEEARQSLKDQAVQYGMTTTEAAAYVDEVLSIPDTATTQAILDTAKAEQQWAWFKATLASNNVVITADLRQESSYYANRAAGSIDFMAAGGLRLTPMKSLAQVVPPNTYRVVGDHQRVPELFAPLDPSSGRSRALWEMAGNMMGWHNAPAVGGPQSVEVVGAKYLGPVYVVDPEAAARRTEAKMRDALATYTAGGQ